MQEIIDAMLQCQAMWMYLESIFSSEDIIAQMPENGRKFSIVDSYWRTIITETVCCDDCSSNTYVILDLDRTKMCVRI